MAGQQNKASIVIASTEEQGAADLEACLKKLGYKVLAKALDEKSAFEVVKIEKPDLVLMDIGLIEKKDNLKAAENIGDRYGAPVIFLVSDAASGQLEKSGSFHPFDYIFKPINDREVELCIEAAIQDTFSNNLKFRRKTLTDNQALFLSFMNHFAGHAFIKDLEGRYVYSNSQPGKRIGLNSSNLIGRTDAEIYPPDMAEEYTRHDRMVIKQGREIEFIESGTHKRGRRLYLVTKFPIYEGKKTAYIGGIAVDVTRNLATEKALAESEAQYEHLVENVNIIILRFDSQGRISYINRFGLDYFGYEKHELVGRPVLETIVPEIESTGRNLALLIDEIILEPDKFLDNENENLKKSGERTWVNWRNAPIKNDRGQLVEILAVGIDITDRKQVEEALRKSEETFRSITEQITDAVFITDYQGVITYISPAVNEIFGFAVKEMVGRHFLEYVAEDQHTKALEKFSSVVSNGGLLTNFELILKRKGNNSFPGEVNATRFESEGKTIGTLGLIRDVSERRKAEAEKDKLRTQLQQAQKMEAVGTLAGGISHDFNNLLQAISGYTQLLILDKNEDDPDLEQLTAIQEAGERAAALVRQLLLFSRKAETERQPLNPNLIIEQARKILERTIPKMIDIELHPGGRLWYVNADPVQIEQVVLNLGSNAADAMPEGGRLVVETKNVTLDDDYTRSRMGIEPGKYVQITVSDTGHGIEKEDVEHIFEPFFTTKAIGKGTGLGLASVYGIVKGHGGYIYCYSEIGQGTTFRIYLPAARSSKDQTKIKAVRKPMATGSERILLVDDEEMIRNYAMRALKRFGYEVLTASNGEEALEIYCKETKTVELVILDIGMPGMGGHKCMRRLMEVNPSVRVIISSGYSKNGSLKETLKSGAAAFVGKPYDLDNLLNTVRMVLDRKD